MTAYSRFLSFSGSLSQSNQEESNKNSRNRYVKENKSDTVFKAQAKLQNWSLFRNVKRYDDEKKMTKR